MEDNSAIMMMQVIASFKSEEDLIEDAIVALTKYKEEGCKGEKPTTAVTLCFLKWEQKGNSLKQIIKDTEENLELMKEVIERKSISNKD